MKNSNGGLERGAKRLNTKRGEKDRNVLLIELIST